MTPQMSKMIGGVVLLERIGKGQSSEVHRGLKVVNNREVQVAVKIIPKTKVNMALVEAETGILRKIEHPNVVGFFEKIPTNNNIYIVTELCSRGNFSEFVKANYESLKVPEAHVKKYLKQIARGLDKIHRQHIVHRDLKKDNIFITEQFVIKIGDFGFAKLVEENVLLTSFKGTPINTAPEIFNAHNTGEAYDNKCDIWSLGTVFYELLFGRPIDNIKDVKELNNFVRSKREIELPTDVELSQDCRDLLLQMLRRKPSERPSTSEILAHPFLADTSANLLNTSQLIKSFFDVANVNAGPITPSFFASSKLDRFIALLLKEALKSLLEELCVNIRRKIGLILELISFFEQFNTYNPLIYMLLLKGANLIEKFSNISFEGPGMARITPYVKRLIDQQSTQFGLTSFYSDLKSRLEAFAKKYENFSPQELTEHLHLMFFELVEENLKHEFKALDSPAEQEEIRAMEDASIKLGEVISFDFTGITYDLGFSRPVEGLKEDLTDLSLYVDKVEAVERDDFSDKAYAGLRAIVRFGLSLELVENYPSEKVAQNLECFRAMLKMKAEGRKS